MTKPKPKPKQQAAAPKKPARGKKAAPKKPARGKQAAAPKKPVAPKKPAAGRKRTAPAKPARLIRSPYSRKELREFEQALLEEKRRILRQGRATDEIMESGGTDATSGEPTRRTHAAEIGGESHQVEVASRLKQMEGAIMREITDALRRIENDTYGICESCGKPIPKARLEVVPHAHFCMVCLRK